MDDKKTSILKFGELTTSTKGLEKPAGGGRVKESSAAGSPTKVADLMHSGASAVRSYDNPTGTEIMDKASSEFAEAFDDYYNSNSNESSSGSFMDILKSAFGVSGSNKKDADITVSAEENSESSTDMDMNSGESDTGSDEGA